MLDDAIVRALWDRQLLTEGQSLQPDTDIAIINGLPSSPNGVLMLRPSAYAHTFNLHPSVIGKIRVADRLWHYGMCAAASIGIRGLTFHIRHDNAEMRRYAESKGAICEPDSLLYRFDLPHDFTPEPYKERHHEKAARRSNLRSFPSR